MKLSQAALLVALVGCSAAQAATVGVDNSAGGPGRPWLGFMNVFDLSNNFQFASGWGVGDLNASFNDGASTLTLSPNTIGDTNQYWYQGVGTNPGGPGAPGNKLMEANLYQEDNTNVYSGTTLTFAGFIQSNTFTSAHVAKIFVRDFAPDYSSFNENTIAMVPGAFSVSLNTLPGPGRAAPTACPCRRFFFVFAPPSARGLCRVSPATQSRHLALQTSHRHTVPETLT